MTFPFFPRLLTLHASVRRAFARPSARGRRNATRRETRHIRFRGRLAGREGTVKSKVLIAAADTSIARVPTMKRKKSLFLVALKGIPVTCLVDADDGNNVRFIDPGRVAFYLLVVS